MNTLLRLILFFVILFVGFIVLAFYWTFYKPLPDYKATIESVSINEPIDIHWDDFGVPHIYASNEHDLYYSLGYTHAQDRLWQMTISQLAGEGRFAEYFGPDLVDFDKYHRTLGFWKMAGVIEDSIKGTPEYEMLLSFSSGVNDFVNQNKNRLPVQYALTGIEPIEWTPRHSLALIRLMAWELNVSWWSEVAYNYLKGTLPEEQFSQLELAWLDTDPTTLNDAESGSLSTSALLPMLELEFDRRRMLEIEGSHVGSNAWVIDGTKTSTGYPMLAGDPHLGLDMPGKWYEVHLSLNGKNVSGVTIPGIPGVVLGQNDEMAWSFTSMMSDDTDFFLETVDIEDRGRYVSDSSGVNGIEFEPFTTTREIIKVKDADEQIHEVRYSKHGPIITDIYPTEELVQDQVIAMSWTGHEFSNELKAMREMNWASSFQEFRAGLPNYGVPGMNFMYADKQGNIAMFSTAKLPLRNGDRVTLRRGWNPDDDWKGFIPFDEMPHIINPEKGWIANANNKITTDNYPNYIASFWEPPSRIQRIIEVLESKDQFIIEEMIALQNDAHSHFAATLTPILLDIINSQNEYDFSIAVSYLENWDYNYDANSTAASIFDVFFQKLTENTLKDEFGNEAYQHFIVHEMIPVRTMTEILQDTSSFFDNITTPEIEVRQDIVMKSMQDAILFLSDSLGIEPFEWRWEQLHSITFKPPLFSIAAEAPDAPSALKLIVNNLLSKGPYPVVGHGMSVNNGQYRWSEPFEMTLGASVRRIVDLSDLSNTKSVLSTGQSGNPISTHYGDQTDLWLTMQYRNFFQDSTFFTEVDYKTMKFVPEE